MSEFKAMDTALKMLYDALDRNCYQIKSQPEDLAICRNCNWTGPYEKLTHRPDDLNRSWVYVCPTCESSDWCSTLEPSVNEGEGMI